MCEASLKISPPILGVSGPRGYSSGPCGGSVVRRSEKLFPVAGFAGLSISGWCATEAWGQTGFFRNLLYAKSRLQPGPANYQIGTKHSAGTWHYGVEKNQDRLSLETANLNFILF